MNVAKMMFFLILQLIKYAIVPASAVVIIIASI